MRVVLPPAIVAVLLGWTEPAGAQPLGQGFQPRTLSVSLLGGGAAYTDFLRTVERGAGSADASTGLRRISAATTASVGAAVDYAHNEHWSLRLHAGWAPSRFAVILPAEAGRTDRMDESDHARLHVTTVDVSALFRIPLAAARIEPYGIVGGGVVEFRARPGSTAPLPADASHEFARGLVRRAVGVLGAGALVPVARRSSRLIFEITGHVGATPLQNAIESGAREEDRVGVSSQIRFQLGLSVPIARVAQR